MTKNKLILICISVLAVCGILWGYIGLKEELQNLQKIIDTQEEMLYIKDNQILEMNKIISGQEEKLIESYDKIQKLEDKQLRTMNVKITHYSSEETGSTMTASGRHAQEGRTVACNFLPLGTQVLIDGNVYHVEDRGAMAGYTVDIYVGSTHEALSRGTYHTTMEVL